MILENLDLNSLLKKLDEENQIWYSGDTMFVPFNVYFIKRLLICNLAFDTTRLSFNKKSP